MTAVMRRIAPAAGFTLLELLVAITVLALLTALLFGGLQFGTRVWRIGDAELGDFAAIDAAYSLLHRALTTASPRLTPLQEDETQGQVGRRGEPRAPTVDFSGRPNGVMFVAPAPAAVLGGGLFRISIGVVAQRDSGQLVVALAPLTAEGETLPAGATVTRLLLDGIARARFAYFGRSGDADEAAWHDRWEEETELPELVSLQIEFHSGDRRVWPQLMVAPLLSPPLQ